MDKNRCFLDSRSWTEAAQVLSVTPVSELQQGKVKDLFYICKFMGCQRECCQSYVRIGLARVTKLSLYL